MKRFLAGFLFVAAIYAHAEDGAPDAPPPSTSTSGGVGIGYGGSGSPSIGIGGSLFAKGRTRLSASAGWGSSFNEDYVVLGLGAGYYLMRGLEAGLDSEFWLGSDPTITKVSPQLRYVFDNAAAFKPYLGAFYRRTFFSGFDDLDSVGGRFGAYFPLGTRAYTGLGGVYERYLDCENTVYQDCSQLYPEFTISAVF
jgi:hypothetical protein